MPVTLRVATSQISTFPLVVPTATSRPAIETAMAETVPSPSGLRMALFRPATGSQSTTLPVSEPAASTAPSGLKPRDVNAEPSPGEPSRGVWSRSERMVLPAGSRIVMLPSGSPTAVVPWEPPAA